MSIIPPEFKNFHDFLSHQSKRFADRPCLTYGNDPTVSFTYREFEDMVNRTAVLLSSLGLKKGDRFALITKNCPEYFFLYMASMKLGTLLVPLVADMPIEEVKRMLATSGGVRALFVSPARQDVVDALLSLSGTTIPPDHVISLADFGERVAPLIPDTHLFDNVLMSDPGSLYFSSGTTGLPKGIPHSPKNLLTAAYDLARLYGLNEYDTQVGVLPCYHIALIMHGFWPSIVAGSRFVFFEQFIWRRFWKDLADFKAAYVNVVPTILTMLLNDPEDVSRYDLRHLKFIGSGSAPLPANLQERFEKTFGVRVAVQYGLSESPTTHFNVPDPTQRKLGSVGKPSGHCASKIVTETGEETAPNEVGEIVMQGDCVIDGYHNNPEENAKAFRNGWFYTGDLAYRDEDGFFFLVSRAKEMINRGGQKIYPNEVDNVLLMRPDLVREVATVGVPDPTYGEKVVAYVVPTDPDDFAANIDTLAAHCRKHVARYKCPAEIIPIEEIPKTASGKIFRRKLVAAYRGESL